MKQWKNKLRLIAASAAAFCLLTVQLHAADLEELRPGAYRITGYQICDGTGTAFIAGSKVPAEWAKQIRNGGVLRLDVSVEPI